MNNQKDIKSKADNKSLNKSNITWFVEDQVKKGIWNEETIPIQITGLSRPIKVFRTNRKTNHITYSWHGDKDTFCPPIWWDLAIGSGACGLGCRACFLMLTHRIRRDPWRHLLYENLNDFISMSQKWLIDRKRKPQHTLGVGIDRSDSLLYEGVAPHVRSLAPIFSNPISNPANNKLILLTKTTNTQYLEEIPPNHRKNIIVSFSLNPEKIADLWEGKWPDGERITPPISKRLEAAKYAQDLGYEIRIRLDPILTLSGWLEHYTSFISVIKSKEINFRYWTMGTYREKNFQLDTWREKWGLLPMEWQLEDHDLEKDGTHWHLPAPKRIDIYSKMKGSIQNEFPNALVSLCKETHKIRKAVALCNADCNCLI